MIRGLKRGELPSSIRSAQLGSDALFRSLSGMSREILKPHGSDQKDVKKIETIQTKENGIS
jgi:hypothetical protein